MYTYTYIYIYIPNQTKPNQTKPRHDEREWWRKKPFAERMQMAACQIIVTNEIGTPDPQLEPQNTSLEKYEIT